MPQCCFVAFLFIALECLTSVVLRLGLWQAYIALHTCTAMHDCNTKDDTIIIDERAREQRFEKYFITQVSKLLYMPSVLSVKTLANSMQNSMKYIGYAICQLCTQCLPIIANHLTPPCVHADSVLLHVHSVFPEWGAIVIAALSIIWTGTSIYIARHSKLTHVSIRALVLVSITLQCRSRSAMILWTKLPTSASDSVTFVNDWGCISQRCSSSSSSSSSIVLR